LNLTIRCDDGFLELQSEWNWPTVPSPGDTLPCFVAADPLVEDPIVFRTRWLLEGDGDSSVQLLAFAESIRSRLRVLAKFRETAVWRVTGEYEPRARRNLR
jgi:hypothetical protein